MIFVDYLQLMDGEVNKGNREQEIGKISRMLKAVAKELNIPVLALSQLSRAVESRPGNAKRPMLSDLRESGSIEQDADIVMFLYRAEYYKITEDEAGRSTNGMAEILVAKNRHGATDDINVQFISRFTKFCDWEDTSNDGFEIPKEETPAFTPLTREYSSFYNPEDYKDEEEDDNAPF